MARIRRTAFNLQFTYPLRAGWLGSLALLLQACSGPSVSEDTGSLAFAAAKKPGGPRGMRLRISRLSLQRPSVVSIGGLPSGGVRIISTNQRAVAGSSSPIVQTRLLEGETNWSLVTTDGAPLALDSNVSILYDVLPTAKVTAAEATGPVAFLNAESGPGSAELDASKGQADSEPEAYAEVLADSPTEQLFTFVHEATEHNISENETCIDDSKLEMPLGADHYIGVDETQGGTSARYVEGGVGRWCIFRDDVSSPVHAGQQFTVTVSSARPEEPNVPATAN